MSDISVKATLDSAGAVSNVNALIGAFGNLSSSSLALFAGVQELGSGLENTGQKLLGAVSSSVSAASQIQSQQAQLTTASYNFGSSLGANQQQSAGLTKQLLTQATAMGQPIAQNQKLATSIAQTGARGQDIVSLTKNFSQFGQVAGVNADVLTPKIMQLANQFNIKPSDTQGMTDLTGSMYKLSTNTAGGVTQVSTMTDRLAGLSSTNNITAKSFLAIAASSGNLDSRIRGGATGAVQGLFDAFDNAQANPNTNSANQMFKFLGTNAQDFKKEMNGPDGATNVLKDFFKTYNSLDPTGQDSTSQLVALQNLNVDTGSSQRTAVGELANQEVNDPSHSIGGMQQQIQGSQSQDVSTAYGAYSDTNQAKMQEFHDKIELLKNSIGQDLLPVLNTGASAVGFLATAFGAVPAPILAGAAALATLVGGGALAIGMITKLAGIAGTIQGGVSKIRGALGGGAAIDTAPVTKDAQTGGIDANTAALDRNTAALRENALAGAAMGSSSMDDIPELQAADAALVENTALIDENTASKRVNSETSLVSPASEGGAAGGLGMGSKLGMAGAGALVGGDIAYQSSQSNNTLGRTAGEVGGGALLGASIGSIVPGVGTLLGGGIGALGGGLVSAFQAGHGNGNNGPPPIPVDNSQPAPTPLQNLKDVGNLNFGNLSSLSKLDFSKLATVANGGAALAAAPVPASTLPGSEDFTNGTFSAPPLTSAGESQATADTRGTAAVQIPQMTQQVASDTTATTDATIKLGEAQRALADYAANVAEAENQVAEAETGVQSAALGEAQAQITLGQASIALADYGATLANDQNKVAEAYTGVDSAALSVTQAQIQLSQATMELDNLQSTLAEDSNKVAEAYTSQAQAQLATVQASLTAQEAGKVQSLNVAEANLSEKQSVLAQVQATNQLNDARWALQKLTGPDYGISVQQANEGVTDSTLSLTSATLAQQNAQWQLTQLQEDHASARDIEVAQLNLSEANAKVTDSTTAQQAAEQKLTELPKDHALAVADAQNQLNQAQLGTTQSSLQLTQAQLALYNAQVLAANNVGPQTAALALAADYQKVQDASYAIIQAQMQLNMAQSGATQLAYNQAVLAVTQAEQKQNDASFAIVQAQAQVNTLQLGGTQLAYAQAVLGVTTASQHYHDAQNQVIQAQLALNNLEDGSVQLAFKQANDQLTSAELQGAIATNDLWYQTQISEGHTVTATQKAQNLAQLLQNSGNPQLVAMGNNMMALQGAGQAGAQGADTAASAAQALADQANGANVAVENLNASLVNLVNYASSHPNFGTPGPTGGGYPGIPGDTGNILGNAEGGYFTSPTLGIFGENGPEVILPLSDPQRMAEILQEAGLSDSTGGINALSGLGSTGTPSGTATATTNNTKVVNNYLTAITQPMSASELVDEFSWSNSLVGG